MNRFLTLLLALSLSTQLAFAQDSSLPKKKWSTAAVDGVQWLINPDGETFYSKGVNIVTPGKDDEKSRAGHAYCWMNFYPSIDQWRLGVGTRLREWGFNTLGGWSDSSPDLGLPLMVDLELGRNSHFHWFDPFHPQMEQSAIETAIRLTAPYKGLPQLIGYFSDNEVGWWNSSLFIWYLKAGWDNYTKRHLWQMIHDQYDGDWGRLLVDWVPPEGIHRFDDLKTAGANLKLRPHGNGICLVNRFMKSCTKRYYEIMYKAIRTAHPDALVLGDRLPLYYHQDAILSIGDNIDVISTNYNVDVPDGWIAPYYFDGLRKLSPKPVMVTEFFFAAEENRSGNRNETAKNVHAKPGHLMTVDTQIQRSWGAGAALLNFARFPNLVGAHWFQYCDEPLGGREDGEDYNMGLIDTSNRPYEELTGGFKKLNPVLETVHALSIASESSRQGAGEAKKEAAANGAAEPVRIARAEQRIEVGDQSLIEWQKQKTLLSGFSAPAPYVPFGDIHLAWRPEGFYLFSLSNTYVDPGFLDYRGRFPQSEAFQFHFTIEAEGKRNHLATFLIPEGNPSFPDGFEIAPELFRIENGKTTQRLPVSGHVQKLEKALPHMAVEAFFPAEWFGVDELKAGMRLKANVGLVSYFREFSMTWAGRPEVTEVINPSSFREILLAD
ncbi:MAG: hypothetical protein AB9866_19225 [Syntrophobacteraceae bacterium]